MSRAVTIRCDAEDATRALAHRLAACAVPGGVVVLTGPLGAGKTTFAKAYAVALGVTVPVTSPPYTLVHHYPCGPAAPVRTLLHADCWRLSDPDEVADLALDEQLDEDAAALVEWGERVDLGAGRDTVVVTFEVTGDRSRTLTVDGSRSSVPDTALGALAAP